MKTLLPLIPPLLVALLAGPAQAADSQVAADWSLSADGAYVLDQRAGLAWPRCVEGMQWNGKTCTGQPLLLDRAEATALASDRWKAEGVGWRIPRAAELQRLVDKSLSPPGLNPILFPAAPGQWHWSSTANVSAPSVNQYTYGNIAQGRAGDGARQAAMINGWAVNLSTGEARGDAARASKLPVRLVRPMPMGGGKEPFACRPAFRVGGPRRVGRLEPVQGLFGVAQVPCRDGVQGAVCSQ